MVAGWKDHSPQEPRADPGLVPLQPLPGALDSEAVSFTFGPNAAVLRAYSWLRAWRSLLVGYGDHVGYKANSPPPTSNDFTSVSQERK